LGRIRGGVGVLQRYRYAAFAPIEALADRRILVGDRTTLEMGIRSVVFQRPRRRLLAREQVGVPRRRLATRVNGLGEGEGRLRRGKITVTGPSKH
jgi:hypothetical protein